MPDDSRDACNFALLAAGLWSLFAGYDDRNERVMDVMEFVQNLDPSRFSNAQPGFAKHYSSFLRLAD